MKQDREPWTPHSGREGGPAVLPTFLGAPGLSGCRWRPPRAGGTRAGPSPCSPVHKPWGLSLPPLGTTRQTGRLPGGPLCSRPPPPGNVALGNGGGGVLRFTTGNFPVALQTRLCVGLERHYKRLEDEDKDHLDVRSACGGRWSPRSLQGDCPGPHSKWEVPYAPGTLHAAPVS